MKWRWTILWIATTLFAACQFGHGIQIIRQGLQARYDGFYIAVAQAEREMDPSKRKSTHRRWVGRLWFNLQDRGKQVVRGDTFTVADASFKVVGFLPGTKRNAIVLRRLRR